MQVVRFPTQLEYPDGRTMCSAASILMCVYVLKTEQSINDVSPETMELIMAHSNQLFRTFLRPHGSIFHTPDVMSKINLKQRCPLLKTREVAGLITGTPQDMCGDGCMDLNECLDSIEDRRCCTLTFQSHTIAFGKHGRHTWLFDSLTGRLTRSTCEHDIRCLLDTYATGPLEYSAVVMELDGSCT